MLESLEANGEVNGCGIGKLKQIDTKTTMIDDGVRETVHHLNK